MLTGKLAKERQMTYKSFGMLMGTAVALAIPASAQEKKIDRSDLPASVVKTMDGETRGSTIKGYSTERENGKKVYEVETVLSGHTRDLQIAEDGTLNEIEEEVSLTSLPDAVQKGLEGKAKGAKITKVESLTKGGRLVAYEAATLRGAKKGEVQVGPDGAGLKHSE